MGDGTLLQWLVSELPINSVIIVLQCKDSHGTGAKWSYPCVLRGAHAACRINGWQHPNKVIAVLVSSIPPQIHYKHTIKMPGILWSRYNQVTTGGLKLLSNYIYLSWEQTTLKWCEMTFFASVTTGLITPHYTAAARESWLSAKLQSMDRNVGAHRNQTQL